MSCFIIKQRYLEISQAISVMVENFVEQRSLSKQRGLEILNNDAYGMKKNLNNDPYGRKKFLNNDAYKNFKQRSLGRLWKKIISFTENPELIWKLAFFITLFNSMPMPSHAANMPAFKPGLSPMRCTFLDE